MPYWCNAKPLSQKKSSCRYAGVVYLSSPFLGAPEEIRELNCPFFRSCDKNGLSLSQNNANALFCLASLGVLRVECSENDSRDDTSGEVPHQEHPYVR